MYTYTYVWRVGEMGAHFCIAINMRRCCACCNCVHICILTHASVHMCMLRICCCDHILRRLILLHL